MLAILVISQLYGAILESAQEFWEQSANNTNNSISGSTGSSGGS